MFSMQTVMCSSVSGSGSYSTIDLYPLTVESSTRLQQVVELMGQSQQEMAVSCAVVVEESKVLGILTESDIVRLIAKGVSLAELTAADGMTQPVVTVPQTELHDPIATFTLLRQQQLHHLPIVDHNAHLVGVLTPASMQRSLQPNNLLKLHRVQDVMITQVPQTGMNVSVLQLAQLMTQSQANYVVIVDQETEQCFVPVGMVTTRDLVQFQAREGNLAATPVQSIMRAPLFCLHPSDSLWLAHEEMQQQQVPCMVVTDDQGRFLGAITQVSCFRILDPAKIQPLLRHLRQSLQQPETEKVDLWQTRNSELERLVRTRNAQLEEQAKYDRLLARITLRIYQSLNLQEILSTTVSEVQQVLQTDRTLICQLDPHGQGVVRVEAVKSGWTGMLGQTFEDDCFTDWLLAYRNGRISAINDIRKADLSHYLIDVLAQYQVQANLIVPILQGQDLWGFLMTQHCAKPWRWQYSEIRLLEQLVKQLGIAIQQSELFLRAQAELSERQRVEGELARLFKLSSDMVGVADMNGYLKRLNSAFTTILGYSEQELLAQPFFNFVHPDDLASTLAEFKQLSHGMFMSYFENRCRCQDGLYKWLAWTVAPHDPIEGLVYVIARDITEQKEAAAQQATQFAITRILAESICLHEALPKLLQALCEGMNWELGELWQPHVDRLHLESFWHQPSVALSEFAAANQSISLSWGYGIPGRVWSSGEALWIPDVLTDNQFICPGTASEAGLHAAIGFPLSDGNQITGVMVFFSHSIRPPNEKLLNMMADIGQHISQFIERKRAEKALQESEERLRMALEAAKIGIWDYDLVSDKIRWSERNNVLFGLGEGEFLGTLDAFMDCIHPDDREPMTLAVTQALRNKTSYIQEFRVVWADQSIRWLISKGQIFYQADQAVRMMGTVTDITERKRAEFALKQANDILESRVEERTTSWRQVADQLLIEIAERNRVEDALRQTNDQLQAVLDAVPGLVSWISADQCYRGVNRHLAATFNCAAEEFVGKPIGFLDKNPYFSDFIRQFFASSVSTASKEIMVQVDGTNRSYLIVAQKYNHDQTAVSVGIDITDHKQAEKAVQESEARFRNLVEQINDWVWEIDHDQKFVYVSPRVQDIIGYEPDAVLAKRIFDFMVQDEAVRFSTVLNYFILHQDSFSQLETTILHQAGHRVVLEISGAPVFNAQGRLQGYRGITRDITERKQVERNIRVALTKEKELSELKTRFISMASHEFRTPLTTILASAESIERYRHKWSEEKMLTSLHRIQGAVKHMTRLLNDVLILGKAEAGKLECKPTQLNLQEFCVDLVEELRLEATHPERLQFSQTGDCTDVWVDEKLLHHILVNLLSNALKYSPAESQIKFDLVCRDDTIMFQVQDSGIGIPISDRKRVFESFHRAANVGTIPGTGLGLAIVKRSVEAHHGKIRIESDVGVGTTFTVTLPANPSGAIPPEGS